MKEENTIKLNDSLQYLKGVDPKKFNYLKALGLETIHDMLFYFPRAWEDRRVNTKVNNLELGVRATILVEVVSTSSLKTRNGFIIFEALLKDKTTSIKVKWIRKYSRKFNVLFYLTKDIKKGAFLFLTGELTIEGFNVIDYETVSDDSINANRIIPIYPASLKIDTKFLRSLLWQVSQYQFTEIKDFLPKKIKDKRKLMSLPKALRKIHFPTDWAEKQAAYFRLAFDEFFLLEIVLMKKYHDLKKIKKSHTYKLTKTLLSPFRKHLGFEFTNDQKKVINEIFTNMQSNFPMNRLLQGNVGSEKTVVALSAMLLAVESGYQAAIMAPTEVLARQHFESIKKVVQEINSLATPPLNKSSALTKSVALPLQTPHSSPNAYTPISLGILTGSMTKKQKTIFKEKNFDILIGTHALFSENMNFKNLKLIVIDEQHKFGVKERLMLRDKASTPYILVMTATPIPRTLAMSIYGDLDISTIKMLPKGRKPIKTIISKQNEAIQFMLEEIHNGRQEYLVYPAIEENNKLELKSAEEMFKKLNIFKILRWGYYMGK
ncbi:MAG: DEAD/DEAH box helicase [bacterium]|nr:DEAD/DEAH box helicase [bacterium]